jgi:hypothetical protein
MHPALAILIVVVTVWLCYWPCDKLVKHLNTVRYHWIQFGNHLYCIATKKGFEHTEKWLTAYAHKHPGNRCAECGGLILPGHPVGYEDGEFFHHGPVVCHPLGAEWGTLSDFGVMWIPTYQWDLTAIEMQRLFDGMMIYTVPCPRFDKSTFILFHVERNRE